MFLAVTEARDGRSFFVGTGCSAKKSEEHRTFMLAKTESILSNFYSFVT